MQTLIEQTQEITQKNTITPQINKSDDYIFSFGTTYRIEWCDKKVATVEKIPYVGKSGNSYVNSRIYFEDNTNELYENKDLSILPNWTIRFVTFYINDHPQIKKIVKETGEELQSQIEAEDIEYRLYNNIRSTIKISQFPIYFCTFTSRIFLISTLVLVFVLLKKPFDFQKSNDINGSINMFIEELLSCTNINEIKVFLSTILPQSICLYLGLAIAIVLTISFFITKSNVERKQERKLKQIYQKIREKNLPTTEKLISNFSKICKFQENT